MGQNKDVQYTDYLGVESLLNNQKLESTEQGETAHEEMLFIITHQTYELWFKQILWELDSTIALFEKETVEDQDLSVIVHRMKRINKIWDLLVDQIHVLETMTPLEFLEFRNYLYPASGFQSAQFRLIENKLGLPSDKRKTHNGCPYHQFISEKEVSSVLESEKTKSIAYLVEKWLERTPYLKTKDYDFWSDYKRSVVDMFETEMDMIEQHSQLHPDEKKYSIESIKKTLNSFLEFMDKDSFYTQKDWSFSFESLQAALFIQLYRHEPKLQLANRLIEELIHLDEKMTLWRSRHAQMALRMLGEKVGTGGSSGAQYLKEATDEHKVFHDFFKLTTYFIQAKHLTKPSHLK